MAFTGEALLEQALFDHLATLTTTPATAFAWPSVDFDGTARPYLQVNHLPNTARQNTFSPSKDLPGFLIVTAVFAAGEGTLTTRNVCTQIIDHFPTTLRLFTAEHRIQITDPPTAGRALVDGPEVRIPVSIPYLATT
ncbi:MAG: hypothetical protein KI785_05435 [Devosiaceae bacterium]|nr:hypothetical protein [Devosiaceae bacterium MH13]